MKTAVIYARYSSDSQTEQSIEGQLRVCNEYAKNNVGYSWGIIRVGSLLPTRFSFPHAILMRFNPNRIVAN